MASDHHHDEEFLSDAAAINPAVPFFGPIGYTVTEELMRKLSSIHPDLALTASKFLKGTSRRRGYYRPYDIDEEADHALFDEPPVPRSVVERDLRKWAVFLASGLKHTLACYRGKWVFLTADGLRYERDQKSFKISPGFKQTSVALGGQPMIVSEDLPADWQAQSWCQLVVVSDGSEVLGHVETPSVWDAGAKAWTTDAESSIERLGLADVRKGMISEIVNQDRKKRSNYVWLDAYLAVNTIYLSKTHIVTSDKSMTSPVRPVLLEDYRKRVEKLPREMNRYYGSYFEDGIRKFANDQILHGNFQCLDEVVDIFVAEIPDVMEAKNFGPRGQYSFRQQEKLFSLLRKMHGVAAFPIPAENDRRGFRFHDRQDRTYQPRDKEIDQAEVERLREAYKLDPVTAFKGSFWRQWEPLFLYKDEEPKEIGSTFFAQIRHLPTDALMAQVVAARPEAAELMRQWRGLFDRCLPDWQASRVRNDRLALPSKDKHRDWLESTFQRSDSGLSADTLGSIDFVLRDEPKQEPDRDCQAAITDATLALAIAYEFAPRGGVLASPLGIHIVNALDDIGQPLLEDAIGTPFSKRFQQRSNRKFDFWNWPFLLPHLGRLLAKVDTFSVGQTLFDMKLHGHAEAVLTDFKRTHVLDLSKADTIQDLALLAKGTIEYERNRQVLFVTERMKMIASQRFFVVDGRVVASSSLDRNLSVLDASGKRLDERVRQCGSSDVDISTVNRPLAAALAKKARAIAKDLKRNGILECDVDVTMSERGPVLTWVNLPGSELGSVSLNRYVASFRRKRAALRDTFKERLIGFIGELIKEPWLKEKCIEAIDRNHDNLTAIVERQFEIASRQMSSSNATPENFVAGAAASFVLTALLETPPGLHSSLSGEAFEQEILQPNVSDPFDDFLDFDGQLETDQ